VLTLEKRQHPPVRKIFPAMGIFYRSVMPVCQCYFLNKSTSFPALRQAVAYGMDLPVLLAILDNIFIKLTQMGRMSVVVHKSTLTFVIYIIDT
jgi:hypothetical protein